MPWHVGKSGECPDSKPWAVIKDDDGEVVGCHETKEDAVAQLVALKINVEESPDPKPGWLLEQKPE